MIFGAINLVVCVPLHLVALPSGRRAATTGRSDSRSRRIRCARRCATRPFTWLAAAFTVNALVFSGTSVHLLAMLGAKGLTATQAAAFGALIGPMQVLGRLLEIIFGRRAAHRVSVSSRWAYCRRRSLCWFRRELQRGASSSLPLLYGAGNGVMTIVRGTVPIELYGREHYGAVNGAMAAPVLIAKAAGPLVAAFALVTVHNYDTVALLLALLAAIHRLGSSAACGAATRDPCGSGRAESVRHPGAAAGLGDPSAGSGPVARRDCRYSDHHAAASTCVQASRLASRSSVSTTASALGGRRLRSFSRQAAIRLSSPSGTCNAGVAHARRRRMQHLVADLQAVVAVEDRLTGQQEVGNRAQRVDIGARIDIRGIDAAVPAPCSAACRRSSTAW